MLYAKVTVDIDVLFKVELNMELDKIQYSNKNYSCSEENLRTAFHFYIMY